MALDVNLPGRREDQGGRQCGAVPRARHPSSCHGHLSGGEDGPGDPCGARAFFYSNVIDSSMACISARGSAAVVSLHIASITATSPSTSRIHSSSI